MATSVVQIVNNALIKIGVNSILTLTEDSEAARAANLIYEQVRDDVLADHVWNFAVKRVELAQDTDSPVFGFANQYALPVDRLKVLGLGDGTIQFTIEGSKLLTDSDTAQIKYIRRVEDPNEFSPKFIEALSARLAAELAIPLVDSNSLYQNMYEVYGLKLREARTIDSQESGDAEVVVDTWLNGRINFAGSTFVDIN